MTKMKIGDVVRLRSGGPEMTVDGGPYPPDRYRKTVAVDAGWFDSKGVRHRNAFVVDTLDIVRSAPGFDIARYEGQSMPFWWHAKRNVAGAVSQTLRRLEREFEVLDGAY